MDILNQYYFKFFLALFLLMLFVTSSFACTGIQIIAKDGAAINGRTAEFGIKLDPTILVIPRNYLFKGTLPDGSVGLSYQSKYAVVGADIGGAGSVADGLNEAGLSVGVFYFPDYAGYSQINEQNKSHALSPIEFSNWVLTQFATVDEVKNGLKDIYIAPTIFKSWGFVPSFHYVVYDKSGKSIVIEPINGKLIIYDNPLGVITNSPTFDWHMTNLRNYINLSPLNVAKVDIKGLTLQQFGEGTGLHGLPGDFTPPSRFVRAAIFSSNAIPSVNAEETVFQVFHILNQFDIPVGAVRSDSNGKIAIDSTQATTVKDPKNLKYYIKTYDDQNIRVVNLNAFDLNAKSIKMISTDDKQPVLDISNTAK